MTSSPPAPNVAIPDRAPSTELARHVRAWRMRLSPEDMPGYEEARARGRRRRIVSQEQVAALIGYSTHWYARLELGVQDSYSDDFINQVADVLRLDPVETQLLRLLAGKEAPSAIHSATPEGLQPILEGQPWPAYISNEAWDVVGTNEQLRSWFPGILGHEANVMLWAFTHPDARRRLYRWETDWAPKLLGQLRTAQLRYPDNKRLDVVITEILQANEDARRLWEGPIASFHLDGDIRSLHVPGREKPQPIQIVALEPLRSPGHRLIMLVPVPGKP